MGHVYWEKKEIPIPEGGYINHTDGRVFVFLSDALPTRQSKRMIIGHATSDTTMHPNDNFKFYYPDLWEQHYGEKGYQEHSLRAGMYALTLGIGYETGLYTDLLDIYGPMYANFLMDFSMFSILERSDVAMDFKDKMKGSVCFSKEAYGDSWISDFFIRHMNEVMNDDFRSRWMKRCKEKGISDAWLCIDGSNNDCDALECELAEPGHAKSGTSGNIVSYMYAVTDDGTPLTYMVYNGGRVDSTAFQKMAFILSDHGIKVRGAIVDRGFCTHSVIEALEKQGMPYVLMLKGDTNAYAEMIGKYAETIRWKVKYALGRKCSFGISEKRRIFQSYPEEAYVTLFYDGLNGTQRAAHLIEKVADAWASMNEEIKQGKIPSVPNGVKSYLSIQKEGDSVQVICDYKRWQDDVDGKGFCAIASSEDLPAAEVDRIYHLRDASETQYAILKSQLGYDVTRSHTTEGILNRYAAAFIASIIRAEIMHACQKGKMQTSRMLRELDGIKLLLSQNGDYYAIHDESSRSKELLSQYNIIPADFDFIAADVNDRKNSSVVSQIRKKPAHEEPKKPRKRGPKPKEKSEETKKPASSGRGPGRPKGSKNKKTIEREARMAQQKQELPHRGPGRPKGSKNKNHKDDPVPTQKRAPGRPKGSKDSKPRKRKESSSETAGK